MQVQPPLNSFKYEHLPVLANEVLKATTDLPSEILNYGLLIDATLGGGGHCGCILEAHPTLQAIGLDQDPNARAAAAKHLAESSSRVEILAANFANFNPPRKAAIVLADLGVSSPQLNIAERGFSFRLDGPLDMRMNPNEGITASKLIEKVNEIELANILFSLGEEKFSRRIARRIKNDLNQHGPYKGTAELAYAIAGCYPKKMRHGRIHPATRTFQALRIAVNDELKALDSFLKEAPEWLVPGGLLIIISFHSLEDRLVKTAFKEDERLERITRKPIVPNIIEITKNPRSRSAKCRISRRNA